MQWKLQGDCWLFTVLSRASLSRVKLELLDLVLNGHGWKQQVGVFPGLQVCSHVWIPAPNTSP